MKTLPIIWQRLVTDGQTCGRCGDTYKSAQRAVSKLKKTLHPLGIKPVLETREISEEEFKANPSESNRIWIAGKPLEDWIGATVGTSRCDSVCSKLECRTVDEFESIPDELLIKAALLAAKSLCAATF